ECIPLHFMILARVRGILMADPHLFHRVMYLTVSVVEIAHCTVELMVAQNTVHGDELRFVDIIPDSLHHIPCIYGSGTGTDVFTVDLDDTCITCFKGTEAFVVAKVRRLCPILLQMVQEHPIALNALLCSVQHNFKMVIHVHISFPESLSFMFPLFHLFQSLISVYSEIK